MSSVSLLSNSFTKRKGRINVKQSSELPKCLLPKETTLEKNVKNV